MYDRIKAVEYAKKYAFNYNPDYYNFTNIGGDCTNFVSQCLYAGGIKMDFNNLGWFYNSLNNRSASWTSVESFWNYGKLNKNFKIEETNIDNLQVGDIIQFYNKIQNKYYHMVIVTKIIEPRSIKNILVSSHDNNAYNKSLLQYNVTDFRFGKIIA